MDLNYSPEENAFREEVRAFLKESLPNTLRDKVLAGIHHNRDEQVAWQKTLFKKGFVYSDGWVDDARLVVLNAMDAAERGATVLTRWRCVDAKRETALWQITLENPAGESRHVTACALVNAAGPWASQFLSEHAHVARPKTLRLVKGSHIVVRKMFDHNYAYLFQNPDKRIIFAIPYEEDFTLVGTTDVEHKGAIGAAQIEASEISYLCTQVSRYFDKEISAADVVWSYAGVRPLLDDDSSDPSAVTRDYLLDLDTDQAPLLTVWGGKLTTFRKLAEEAADLLSTPLADTAQKGAWTRTTPLPGGDLTDWIGPAQRPDTDFECFVVELCKRNAHVSPTVCRRIARAYGARAERVLKTDMGAEIAPGLFESELLYLRDYEWAQTADDILWRRSKLGLHFTATQRQAVEAWCARNRSTPNETEANATKAQPAWN